MRLIAALLALSLAGCSLHPVRPVSPPRELPAVFAADAADPAGTPPPERWWEGFADPRLDALLDELLAANLDLAQALARLEQAEAALRGARAALWPSLSVDGQAGREHSPGAFGDNDGTSYRVSLAAGYELDLWQKLRARSRAARLEAQATREELQALILGLSAQLVDGYYLASEQQAQLELTDRTIAAFTASLELVERRYRLGLVSALDVYQARQTLAAAKARRPLYQAGLAKAQHAIALLLGRAAGAGFGPVAALPEGAVAFPAGLPAELLTRRPDVRAALLRLQAQDQRIAAAVAERLPGINLLASLGSSRAVFGDDALTGSFWNLALQAAAPLVDGGRRRAEVARAEAGYRELLAGFRRTVLQALREVEDALVAGQASEARIGLLAERVAASEAALRLAQDRYLQGLSDYLPVLSAQGAHFEAQSQLIAARRQLIVDRISLGRSLGGEWMAAAFNRRLAAAQENNS